jgi:hypothetical protein
VPVEYLVARDGTELAERLYRFRYQIYGDELGIALDHYPAGRMRDKMDESARNYVAVKDGDVIGSLRTCDLVDIPDRAYIDHKYNLPLILEFFAPDEVTYVSRMAVGVQARHTPVMVRLQQYAVQEARARNVRVAFTDCSPKHLSLYGQIGYTPYGPPFQDPVFGLKVPILTVGGDLKLLQERRSPLLKACAPYGDDADARRWFELNVQDRLTAVAQAGSLAGIFPAVRARDRVRTDTPGF